MAEEINNDWGRSVGGVVIRDGKVLLARHTYGNGKGLLIIPGGYIRYGEMPEEAVLRELKEETGIDTEVQKLLGVRFNRKDWYCVFLCRYVSGEAVSDNDENSEVLWVDVKEALKMECVPDLTKKMIEAATFGGIEKEVMITKSGEASLYRVKKD